MEQPKFTIYRSSAGSGKTFTLTKEYLKLVFATPAESNFSRFYFRSILAVTFTNDAANEMKERILVNLKEIAQLSEGESHPMLSLICDELNKEYKQTTWEEEKLKILAAQIHETILHNYADFSVSTIDAFSSKVVKAFKKDLNLPYSFDIELDTEELIGEAVDLLQMQIGQEGSQELTQFLVDFTKKKIEEETSWYLDYQLKGFGEQLFKEEQGAYVAALGNVSVKDFKKIIANLYKYIRNVKKDIRQLGEEAFNLLNTNNIEYEDFYQGNRGIGGFFKKLKEGVELHKIKVDNKNVLKSINEDKLAGPKASKEKKQAIEAIKPNLLDLYYRTLSLVNKELSNYVIANSLAKKIYLLATINELKKELDSIKAEKHIVHISDFNKRINEIVEDEPVPYIYERLGERYKHILIDEFQDTSKMQWHNLIPLVVNALAQNMVNLVVGDAKQAIYRWRGGQANMLVDLPQVPTLSSESVLAEEVGLFIQEENSLQLTVNRRSRDNIVTFNNDLFNWLRDSYGDSYPAFSAFYEDGAQQTNKQPGGKVLLEFAQIEDGSNPYFEVVFERTYQHIKQLTTEQKYQLTDIAILVRKNGHGAFLAEKLMEKGINVVSNESLLLTNTPAINFIIDFLRVIAFPVNPLLKIELIQFLEIHFKALNKDFKSLKGEDYTILKEILEKNDLANYFKWLNNNYGTALEPKGIQFRTIYEIAEELIRQFALGYEMEKQIYLQKLLDLILGFSTKKGNSILEFLDYWELKKEKLSVNSPSASNAVRIMTIHKSKGLQFPVVLMPFADWSTKSLTKEKWFVLPHLPFSDKLQHGILGLNQDLEKTDVAEEYHQEYEQQFIESMNMLYVGFTRAEQCLIAISKEKLKKIQTKANLENLLPKDVGELLLTYANTLEVTSEESTITLDTEKDDFEVILKSFEVYNEVLEKEEVIPQKVEAESKIADYHIASFIHTSSLNKIRLRKNTLRYNDSDLSLNQIFSARKDGILMHYAFEKVKFKEDVPKAVEDLHKEGLIQASEIPTYLASMEKVVNLPQIAKYFEASPDLKIKNEKEIILGGKKATAGTSLRPDRIARFKDELAIIDYKTGSENEEKYAKQIKGYSSAFKKMGYQKIKMFIIYTETGEVVEVE